jgi:hypothetical protein
VQAAAPITARRRAFVFRDILICCRAALVFIETLLGELILIS